MSALETVHQQLVDELWQIQTANKPGASATDLSATNFRTDVKEILKHYSPANQANSGNRVCVILGEAFRIRPLSDNRQTFHIQVPVQLYLQTAGDLTSNSTPMVDTMDPFVHDVLRALTWVGLKYMATGTATRWQVNPDAANGITVLRGTDFGYARNEAFVGFQALIWAVSRDL